MADKMTFRQQRWKKLVDLKGGGRSARFKLMERIIVITIIAGLVALIAYQAGTLYEYARDIIVNYNKSVRGNMP
jgi:hypothetical protein